MNKINELHIALAFFSVGALSFICGLFTADHMVDKTYNEYISNKKKSDNCSINQKIKKYDNLVTNS